MSISKILIACCAIALLAVTGQGASSAESEDD